MANSLAETVGLGSTFAIGVTLYPYVQPIATATAMRVAEQAVYHDRGHPLALVLPVTDSGTL